MATPVKHGFSLLKRSVPMHDVILLNQIILSRLVGLNPGAGATRFGPEGKVGGTKDAVASSLSVASALR
jgi:hypothetical protein